MDAKPFTEVESYLGDALCTYTLMKYKRSFLPVSIVGGVQDWERKKGEFHPKYFNTRWTHRIKSVWKGLSEQGAEEYCSSIPCSVLPFKSQWQQGQKQFVKCASSKILEGIENLKRRWYFERRFDHSSHAYRRVNIACEYISKEVWAWCSPH